MELCSTGGLRQNDRPAKDAAWNGRAALGPGWALFAGQTGDNRPHRHPALQLAIGDGEPVRADVEGRVMTSAGLLIGPDVPHALLPGRVRLLFVERESAWGRRLAATCAAGVRELTSDACRRLDDAWSAADGGTADRVVTVVERLAGQSETPPPSRASLERIRRVVSMLPQKTSDEWGFDLLAAEAQLSPSRFAHAFKEQTGMAPRPYLRWLRLARALESASHGRSLTDAAHDAGFADAAHFSRTMRRHFGVMPSAVVNALRAR